MNPSNAYHALQASEQSLFTLAPLPLQSIKTGIQQVAVPLLVTTAASHIPGVGPVVGAAIHGSGHLLANMAHGATMSSLDSLGNQIMTGLPNGLGIQTSATTLGNAMTPVVSAAMGGIANGLGQFSTAVLIGGTAINAAGMVGRTLADRTIGDVIVSAQTAIVRTQLFLSQAWNQVQSLIQGAPQMSQDYIRDNFGLEKANGLSPETVMAIPDQSLQATYLQLHGYKQELNDIYRRAAEGLDYLKSQQHTLELEKKLGEGVARLEQLIDRAVERGIYHLQGAPQMSQDHSPEIQAQRNEPTYDFDQIQANVNANLQDEPELHSQVNANVEDEPEPDPVKFNPDPTEALEFQPIESHSIDESANEIALELTQKLAQAGVDVSRFGISVDGQSVFKMVNGVPERTKMTAEQAEMINKALTDPANLQGTVRITQGSKVLLHVENGVVKSDMLRLTQPAAKVEVESPTQALYEKASAGLDDHSVKNMKQIAARAIEMGATPKEAMTMLRSHSRAYKGISDSRDRVAAERMAANAVSGGVALAKTAIAPQPRQQTADITR